MQLRLHTGTYFCNAGYILPRRETRQFTALFGMPWWLVEVCCKVVIVPHLGFGVTSVVLRAPRPSLLDDWLRRERFVYVGWSGLLLLPTAYLSRSEVGSPVSPSSHPSTRMR